MIFKNSDTGKNMFPYVMSSCLNEGAYPEWYENNKDQLLGSCKAGKQRCVDSLNRMFMNSKNWILIHDYTFEFEGTTCFIDHVLVNTYLEFFFLTSTFFNCSFSIDSYGVSHLVVDGEKHPVNSPGKLVERNTVYFHSMVKKEGILPKIAGIELFPSFKNIMIFDDIGQVDCKSKNCSNYHFTDMKNIQPLLKSFCNPEKQLDKVATACQYATAEYLSKMAFDLVQLHVSD